MKRSSLTLAISLLFVGAAWAADKGRTEVKITWHGQSYFEIISSKGTRVVIDPHVIQEYGRAPDVYANLIINSHRHNDHTQNTAVENFEKPTKRWPKPKVLEGVKLENGREAWNEVSEKYKDFQIRNVGCYHDIEQGLKRGKNSIFILKVDGISIVHLGDLGHVLSKSQVKEVGKVDVLLIPVGGVYTINGSDAQEVVTQLKPSKYIIPMHCATRAYDALLPPKEFIEDYPREQIARSADNTLTVNVKYKPPKPIIAVLNWEPAPRKKKPRDKDK